MKNLQSYSYDRKKKVLKVIVNDVSYKIPFVRLMNIEPKENCPDSCSIKRVTEDCSLISSLECPKKRNKIHTLSCWIFMFLIIFCVCFSYCVCNNYSFEKKTQICGVSCIGVIMLFVLLEIFIANLEKRVRKRRILKYVKEYNKKKKNSSEIVSSKIDIAKSLVNKTTNLSHNYIFGTMPETLEKCVSSLNDLIETVQENEETYIGLDFIFEIYLPEFYKSLEYYKDFVKNDIVTSELENIMDKCISNFWNMLTKETKVIFDRSKAYINFKTTANKLNDLLKKER